MVLDFIVKALQTVFGLLMLPAAATSLEDALWLAFYAICRLIALPLFYISFDAYTKFLLALYKVLPDLKIRTRYGTFLCKGGTPSISYVIPTYEMEVTRLIERLQLKRGVCIDVGAHVGRYAVMLGRRTKGTVVAVEPEPNNFAALCKNLELNGLNNVKPLKAAVSDRSSTMKFYVHRDSGWHSLLRKSDKSIEVQVRTLDSIVEKMKIDPKDIGLLTVDVEGAPDKVFLGAKRILKESRAKIVFEALDADELNRCRNILERFGYKVKQPGIDRLNFFAEKH